jgi:hypothetical protein
MCQTNCFRLSRLITFVGIGGIVVFHIARPVLETVERVGSSPFFSLHIILMLSNVFVGGDGVGVGANNK